MNVVEMLNLDAYEKKQQKKKVCAYARVSTLKNLQETSIHLQVETYTKMIQNNPEWEFVGVYSDHGKSGTSILKRDQFNLMVDLAKAGNIDLIITKSVSRFARNTIDCLSVIQELKRYGTEVWFEKENLSSFDPKIEFVITVVAGMAQEESRNISENCKWGARKRFKAGIVPMVTSRVLGYERDKKKNIIINEKEAKIVRLIFKLYVEGHSQQQIANHLNKQGLKTKSGGVDYYEGAITGVLNNEKYTGNALLQKTINKGIGSKTSVRYQDKLPKYYVENSHPAIISQELFDKAHAIKNAKIKYYNKTTDKKELQKIARQRSIYNGFVACAVCGKNYHFKVNNANKPWARGELKCASNKHKKVCENDTIFADTFDTIILKHINHIIMDKNKFINTLFKALTEHPAIIELTLNLNAIQAKIKAIDLKLGTLITSDSELDELVKNELIKSKNGLQSEYITYKNKILTSYNISNIIRTVKLLLKPYDKPIESIIDFPFNELFTKVIVHSRYEIEFVIDIFNSGSSEPMYAFRRMSTPFMIRKTEHVTKSRVVIY
jgi:DNA invertase Pin-like site-specific DNA recombinase